MAAVNHWRMVTVTTLAIALLLAGGGTGSLAADWRYRAARGDTPLQVCRSFTRSPGCSLALARLNNIPPRAPIPAGTTIRIPAEWLREVPIVGGVIETGAGAEYKAVDSGAYAPLVAGEPVYLGDTVRTGDAPVVLEFVSGLMIEVRPHSVLVLQSVVDLADNPVVDIDLERGMAAVASTGGEYGTASADPNPAIAGSAGEAVAMEDGIDPASADTALANAVRMLEEQPTAAGAAQRVLHGTGFYEVLQGVLDPRSGGRGAHNSFVPAQLEWPAANGVRSWQVDLLALPRRLDLVRSFVVDEPLLSMPDLAVGCYEVEIRPIDDSGVVGIGVPESLCVHPTLAAPRWQASPDLVGGKARIAWDAVESARGYTVEIASDPGFLRILRSQEVDATAIAPAPFVNGGSFVRVRARNAAGMLGPPSDALPLSQLATAAGSGDPPS
jgi:hypothetical protein